MHKRLPGARVVAAVAAVALVAAGTAYATGALHAAKVTKVAFASPAKQSDYGWNQQGYKGAKAAAASVGAKFQAVTNIGYDKTDVVLRQLAQGGASFIVAHASGYDTVATRIAKQYKVPVMTYDVADEPDQGSRLVHHHVEPAGRLPRRHPGRADDQDPQGRDHHLGLRFQLVQDERRVRGGLPQRSTSRRRSSSRPSARRATTTPQAASASPTA